MKTIKAFFVLMVLTGVQNLLAQSGYGEIRGLIKDNEFNPVIGATIKITQGGFLIGGTTSDENGKYVYKPLDPGEYEMIVTSYEHSTYKKTKIPVEPNEATYVDIKMAINTLSTVVIEVEYEKPLVDATIIDIKSIGAEEISQSPSKTEGVMGLITSNTSAMVQDNSGEWHLHGSRADASEYIIDGVKVASMSGLPTVALENVSLISGGVPAMYGDLTSGVVVVTTKDYFSGMRAKRVRERKFSERYEYKKRQERETEEEKARQLEIEQEKLNNKLGR